MANLNSTLDSIAKPLTPFAPWLQRLTLGISFFIHGYGKFPLPPERMSGWFGSIGMPAPELVSSLVALGETGAGIAIILGGFLSYPLGHLITRLAGGAVVIIMIGAFYIAHADWFITTKLFTSEQIFLLAIGLFFAIKGNN